MKMTLEALATSGRPVLKLSKDEYEDRRRQMRLKLEAEARQKREYHEFMHSIKKSNSRQNVIPGQKESQEEALRSQMLIGKLKANEHLPNAERMRRRGPSAKVVRPSSEKKVKKSKWGVKFSIGKEASESGSSHRESAGGDAQGDVSVASSRDIPGICSDQVSGVSNGSSDQAPEVQLRDDGHMAAASGLAGGHGEGLHEQLRIISKLPSKRALGRLLKKDADYKPHDHVHIEASQAAKEYGLDRALARQEDELARLLTGARFEEPLTEPEPEEGRQWAAEGAMVTAMMRKRAQDLQVNLEQLIQGIQNSTGRDEGYFIYLRQNERSINPYDLVPVMRRESGSAGQQAERREQQQRNEDGERPGSKNRARENLSAIEKPKKSRQVVKKVFKSQYHQEKKEFKVRQSYEGVPITSKKNQDGAS